MKYLQIIQIILMLKLIQRSLNKFKRMDLIFKFGQKILIILAIIKMGWLMEQENLLVVLVNILENLKMINQMDLEYFIIIVMKQYMKDIG